MADKSGNHAHTDQPKMPRKQYERELATLQLELVKMLHWIRESGHRLVVIFEGREPRARAEPSGASPRRSTPASVASWRWRPRPSGSGRSGPSSATSRSCRPPER